MRDRTGGSSPRALGRGIRSVLFGLTIVTLCAATLPPSSRHALSLDGVDDHVVLGGAAERATKLALREFTVELWLSRRGPGVPVGEFVPVLTRGSDGFNYRLGIRASDGVLVAGFREDGSGLDQSVAGVTPVPDEIWYHAAASYDGEILRLYLDGTLEAERRIDRSPVVTGRQVAALGSMVDAKGEARGFFHGLVDEARIWDHARSPEEIRADMSREIRSAPGLRGRWGLNEGAGSLGADSTDDAVHGTLENGPAWVEGVALVGAPGGGDESTLSGALTTVSADDEPVLVAGSELASLLTRPISEIAVFRYDTGSSAYVPIPYQIDERVDKQLNSPSGPIFENMYDVEGVEDGTLDGDDEMVFLFGDAGPQAPGGAPFPAGAEATRFEIEIVDPRGAAPVPARWAYVFAGTGLAQSGVSYVTFDTTVTGSLTTDVFELGFADRWLLNEYRVFSPCGDGSDLIDRFKGRANPNSESEKGWNDTSIYLGGLVGPVRGIRYVQGAKSGINTIHHDVVYRNYWERVFNLRVHPINDARMYLDWLAPPNATFFTPLETTGVPIDGIPDTIATTFVPWNLVRSDAGGLAVVYDAPLSPFYATREQYYVDSLAFNDGAGRPDYNDDDDFAYGDHGINLIGLGDSQSSQIFTAWQIHPLCGGVGDASLGDGYQELVDFPLQITVTEDGCDNPEPDDDTCDGVDDDCDGQVDEDYVSVPTGGSCGIGGCARAEMSVCQAGVVVPQCTPGTPAGDDSLCNGIDDDCDGPNELPPSGTPTIQVDQPAPGEAEVTWGALGDAQSYEAVRGDLGSLRASGGDFASSTGLCLGNAIETGVVSDTEVPAPGQAFFYLTRGINCAGTGTFDAQTASQQGLRDAGIAASAAASQCDGAVPAMCASFVDEDFSSAPTACGVGACASAGATSCVLGIVQDSCTPGTPAPDDATCDAVDDDCDGSEDEDYVATPTACGIGGCAAVGELACIGGAISDTCSPGSPAPDDATCNGIDDDCDGPVDEEFSSQATQCGIGACESTGSTSCVDGSFQDSCSPGTPAPDDATCDAIDDDCDGTDDEDFPTVPTACGIGGCASVGALTCIGGSVSDTCAPGTPAPDDSVCNGIDDDCDGPDELVPSGTPTLGVDTLSPTEASVSWTAATGAGTHDLVRGNLGALRASGGDFASATNLCMADEDDDLNASDADVPAPGDAYFYLVRGVNCAGDGTYDSLGAGQQGGRDTEVASSSAICDGVSSTCLSFVDEDFISQPTSCGVGACESAGNSSCVDGVYEDDCVPGTPAANDATCDGVDDDCDGTDDEDYVTSPTSCGTGACADSGQLECVAGFETDSCTPGTPAPDDSLCNGVDDDCDGPVDEEYAPVATNCGVGACADTGVTSCVGGVEEDSCVPGDPAPDDATCDGIDDDCDGTDDEDFVVTPTACGVGECGAVGSLACVAGVPTDSCVPGDPTLEICNGLDDDCDGPVDEEIVPPAGFATLGADRTGDTIHLSWPSIPGAESYDVIRGEILRLLVTEGDFRQAMDDCLEDDTVLTSVDDSDPAPQLGFYYLVRASNCAGAGSYESGGPGQLGTRDDEIASSSDACP